MSIHIVQSVKNFFSSLTGFKDTHGVSSAIQPSRTLTDPYPHCQIPSRTVDRILQLGYRNVKFKPVPYSSDWGVFADGYDEFFNVIREQVGFVHDGKFVEFFYDEGDGSYLS